MKKKIGLIALAAAAVGAQAADWSDTSINFRRGSNFSEPYNTNNAITKNIIGLNHVSGYKYGTNFFNADLLLSGDKDPAFKDGRTGAHEVYVVYRNTVDLEKETSKAGKEFNKVISVMPLPKGMKCDERANDLIDFGIGDLGTTEFDKVRVS